MARKYKSYWVHSKDITGYGSRRTCWRWAGPYRTYERAEEIVANLKYGLGVLKAYIVFKDEDEEIPKYID